MKMEDGFVYMTREEIAENNIYQRIRMALTVYGPLTAKQLSYLTVGGTIGERTGRIVSEMSVLKKRGEVEKIGHEWRLI